MGAIPTDGLIAHYECETAFGGVLVDKLGNHHGTIYNGAEIIAGPVGNGLYLPGNNARAEVSGLIPAGDYTFGAWLRVDPSASNGAVLGVSNGSSKNFYIWATGNSLQCYYNYFDPGSLAGSVSLGGANSGDLIHLVFLVEKSAGKITIYKDGIYLAETVTAGTLGDDNHILHLADYPGASSAPAAVLFDSIVVYGRIVTAAEISEIHTETNTRPYLITGNVKVDGAPAIQGIRVYDAATGAYITAADSLADGSFSVGMIKNDPVYVMALGPTGYRPLAHGPIVPVLPVA